MKTREVVATLKRLGKPKTATVYKRHGSGDDVYGVLTSDIAKLQKQIGVDHALALELWDTGNAEARILSLLIADPEELTRADAERFVAGPIRFVGCYLSPLLARSPIGRPILRTWMRSKDASKREIGYGIFGVLLKDDPDSVSDVDAAKVLGTIEKEIHRSPNWVRYAMNGALIAIGVYKPALREAAIAAASRIGKVEVDHGETYCKTPDAVAYIRKASRHARARRRPTARTGARSRR
jgi:3-methyladenine DNA glycosylase AlkD